MNDATEHDIVDFEHQAIARLIDGAAAACHASDDCDLCAGLDLRRHLVGLADLIQHAGEQPASAVADWLSDNDHDGYLAHLRGYTAHWERDWPPGIFAYPDIRQAAQGLANLLFDRVVEGAKFERALAAEAEQDQAVSDYIATREQLDEP